MIIRHSGETISLVIHGQPYAKGNSRKIVKFGGKLASIKSDNARSFEKNAIQQVNEFMSDREPWEGDLALYANIYYSSRRPDLDETTLMDVMQERKDRKTGEIISKGIYKNDRQLKLKFVVWHLDPESPRSEITISRLKDWSINDSLRLKRFFLPCAEFMSLFTTGVKFFANGEIMQGLPDDAKIVGVMYDVAAHGIVFVIESSTFDEVPPGQNLPIIVAEIKLS